MSINYSSDEQKKKLDEAIEKKFGGKKRVIVSREQLQKAIESNPELKKYFGEKP